MRLRKLATLLLFFVLAGPIALAGQPDDPRGKPQPKPPKPQLKVPPKAERKPQQEPRGDAITLVDSSGKLLHLSNVKMTKGVRRLAFLANHKGKTLDEKSGPMALEVREPNSTSFQKGVVTLVPLASVESVKYDYTKLSMSVAVNGLPELKGTLQYRGINVLSLESKGGVSAGRYSGGVSKGGFRSLAFPASQPLAKRFPASSWSIQIAQRQGNDPTITVRNLKAIYAFPGGAEQLIEAVPIRKGDPLFFNEKLRKLEMIAVDQNTRMAALEVQVDGSPERLVAVPLVLEQEGRTGRWVGLVGEVDHGWKLFPLHTIKTVRPVAPVKKVKPGAK